jgi:putative MATE family efflux protein
MKLFTADKDFYSKTLKLAIPITLQCFITMGVSMMDNIMVGSLGEDSLSAVSLANQYINIFLFACMGLGQGASILATRFWGMKDMDALRKTISIAIRYCMMIVVLFTLSTVFAPKLIMRMYISDVNVIAEGVRYFGFAAFCYVFWGLTLIGSNVLRSVGEVKIPLIISILVFSIHIGLNYIFIFGKLGFPVMGVTGAALGTLIARIIEFAGTFGYLCLIDKKIQYRLSHIFLRSKSINSEFVKIALPVMISDTLQGFGNSAIAMITGRVGSQFVSAFSITTVVQQMSSVFTQGVAQSSSIVIGHTLGRGETKKAREEADEFLGLGIIVGAIAAVIILVISGPIISCYNIAETTKIMAQELMESIAFIIFFRSVNSILTKGVLRGGGDTKFLMVADIIFLWIASVPLGYLVGVVFHAPAFWTYCALKIDEILKCVLCFYRLKNGKWIKKIRAK